MSNRPSDSKLIVFTDGACLGNPGPGGWGAIVLHPDHQITELGGAADSTTNNRMEISAALMAADFLNRNLPEKFSADLYLYSDSKYFISGISEWIHGWKRRGWKTTTESGETAEVKNRDLWEATDEVFQSLKKKGIRFHFERIAGHVGIPGNERCDEIATDFAKGSLPPLYEGSASDYSISLEIPENLARVSSAKSKRNAPGAYYLSVVGGTIHRDQTWAQCEARVKGNRGAKYKKVGSKAEEESTLKSWGVSSPSKT